MSGRTRVFVCISAHVYICVCGRACNYVLNVVFTDANLFQVIFDLLLAGIDTNSASMHWFMLLMIRNPDIQSKCREEILQVGGIAFLITNDDNYQTIH